MQFFAHIRPDSPTAKAWVKHGLRRAAFAGVTFIQRPCSGPDSGKFRYETELLTTDQIAELKHHSRIVVLEAVTNTRIPKAAP